nr:respiratory burst oxidase homolog protein A [Ipomoea batatas]
MRGIAKHERRWASDSVPGDPPVIGGFSSETESENSSAVAAEEYVEVTLDLQDDDTIILRSVEPATAISIDDLVGGGGMMIEGPVSASGSASTSRSPTIRRSSSNRILQFSQELKAEAVAKARQFSQELKAELKKFSWSHGHAPRAFSSASGTTSGMDSALAARQLRRQRAQLDRTRSGAQKALRGLRFISHNKANAWNEVENNFYKLAKDGYLYRADFAQCIGMKDSKEFALEMFDALSRRRRLKVDKISKEELYEYWSQITDQSFDSRLQIFFDMVDKNEDGRIAEEEVKEIIMLSASANKLSRLKEQAEEYAALIMEELDPERLGYIELGKAMAAGNTTSTEGHILKLQSSTELYEPSLESKPTRLKKEEHNKKNEHEIALFLPRELEENLGFDVVDIDNDRFVHLEIFAVQAEKRIHGHGLLPPHG